MQKLNTLLLILMICITNSIASAQSLPDTKAQSVLDRAIQAIGGKEKLDNLKTLEVIIKGQAFAWNQNWAPDKKLLGIRNNQTMYFDLAGQRTHAEIDNLFPGDFHFITTNIIKAKEGQSVSNLLKTYSKLPEAALNNNRIFLERTIPALLLKRLWGLKDKLSYAGTRTTGKKSYDIISFEFAPQRKNYLYVNQENGLPEEVSFYLFDPALGDTSVYVRFKPFKNTDGLMFPAGFTQTKDNKPAFDVNFETVKVNGMLNESLFDIPADVKESPVIQTTVRKIADGIWSVEGIGGTAYNMCFVEFKDYVMAIEPTGNSQAASGVIARIKQTIPGKPVKYIGVTHFHTDHSGGARPYIVEGAKIITTKGNENYFRNMAKAIYKFTPDTMSKTPKEPVFEFVKDKLVIKDETQTVEIYKLKKTSHVEEMLFFYFPKQKVLYNGDLYSELAPVNKTFVCFQKGFFKMNLEVEKIIGTHHAPMSLDEWIKALAGNEKLCN